MFIKIFFIFVLLIGLSTTVYATGGSCEQNFAESPLMGSWKLLKITEEPRSNPLGKYPYPESIVIKPTSNKEYTGDIEIKLLSKSAPLVYNFSKNGPIWKTTKVVYDKVPDQAPYTLFTTSGVRFETENSLVIELRWEKQDKDGNTEWISFASYTVIVEGETILFTRTNIDDPSKSNTPTVYKATYTHQ